MARYADNLVTVRRRNWNNISEREYQQIRVIWEGAFPPEERFDDDSVASRTSTWLWTVSAADAGLIGFATAFFLGRSGTAYLEYLAVTPARRGSGAGTAVLAAIVDDLSVDTSVSGIVLEVEDPVRTLGADPILDRRLGFYSRWGAHPLQLLTEYCMPDLVVRGGTLPMLILWRGLREHCEPNANSVALILTDLYQDYYAGVAPEGHLENMLGKVLRSA